VSSATPAGCASLARSSSPPRRDIDVGLAGHDTHHDLEIDWDDVVVAPHRLGGQ